MDIPRPENKKRKRVRQLAIGGGTALLLVAVTIGLARLEPAAPSVSRASVWIDTVRQGEMLRQVRGPGTLVPREIRWIAANRRDASNACSCGPALSSSRTPFLPRCRILT